MFAGPCAWYLERLHAAPLPTKCLTSGVLGLAGDGAAQLHEARTRARAAATAGGKAPPPHPPVAYSWRRGLTTFADGLLVSAPLLHAGYGWLEDAIPVRDHPRLPPSVAAAAHVLVDDYVFDAAFIAIMFITTGLGEGYRPGQILDQLRRDYATAVTTMWKVGILLMPLEFCMFRYLPLRLRVLGMNVVELLWDALASFVIHKRRRRGEAREADEGTAEGERRREGPESSKPPGDWYP